MQNISNFKKMMLQTSLITAIFFLTLSFSTRQKPGVSLNAGRSLSEANVRTYNKENDAQFLVKAAEINLEEIELGQLAQQKSMMIDVRELGKMMEKDHSQSMNDLTALARKKLITIPATPTPAAEEAYKKLINKSETTFDKEYCTMMISGHKDAIAMFEKESRESNDADIRQWATETLPHLHMHLEHAIACQSKCEKMQTAGGN
jgi:putative membrane protein